VADMCNNDIVLQWTWVGRYHCYSPVWWCWRRPCSGTFILKFLGMNCS